MSTVFMLGAIRFQAEWVVRQHDETEYGSSWHATREEAQSAAIREGKLAGECEWILVAEQKFIGHDWVDIRRWTGDWDGLHEETYTRDETNVA